VSDQLETGKTPKTGWAKIRGEDVSFKDHMKTSWNPHAVATAGVGFGLASLLRVGGMTSYVTGGVMLVASAFIAAAAIKQIKKKKRAQLAANPPKTS
jgi:hypothetical protein